MPTRNAARAAWHRHGHGTRDGRSAGRACRGRGRGRATRRAWAGPGRERVLVVQSLKAALAAFVAWLVADRWLHAPLSFIAPWVAVVLVRTTVYQSFAQGFQQIAAIALGTVLATAGGTALGVPALAMAVVLPAVLLLGNWPRLGDQGIYGATTALFVLTSRPSFGMAVERLAESLLGALVGVGVNMLVLPPAHLRSAHDAVRAAIDEAARTLHAIADGLEDAWGRRQARDWHHRARRLFRMVRQARSAVERSGESMRLNPDRRRRAQLRRVQPPYRRIVFHLEALADYAVDLTRTLAETVDDDTPASARPHREALAPYALFLHQVADAVDDYGEVVTGGTRPDVQACLRQKTEEARATHDDLREVLAGKAAAGPQWVALYGAFLVDARRIIVQLLPGP
nr:aromatic acid exporter family protein [Streptomyces sp. L2]